jgi:ribosome modulation factor
MDIHSNAKKAGYRANKEGVPLNRNPFQYTSNIFKQAAWIAGWNEAEKETKVAQDDK